MPFNYSRLSGAFKQGVQRSASGKENGLHESVEILAGQGKLLFGNSRLLYSGPSATLSHYHELLRPGTVGAAQANLHTLNQRKNLSVIGAISRAISIPSVSGPAFQVCGYHIDRHFSETSQVSLIIEPLKTLMSASGSRAPFLGSSLSDLTVRLVQRGGASKSATLTSYGRRSFDNCRNASMRLRSKEQPNKFLIYGYFIYNVARRKDRFDPIKGFGLRAFDIISPAFFSTGTAPDVQFDNTIAEEHGAGFVDSPEQNFILNRTLKLNSGSCYLPHPDKEETGGEDAHFICSNERAIGVADGVGGWADIGVDAGQYARELMSNSVNAIEEEPKDSIDPARVLEKAYTSTKAKGSSTACIIALTDEGLHAINLGDSGFMVVRDGCTVFRSPMQQHDFNFTFQLECGNAGDLPSSGEVFKIPVAPGDVIVAGTDGLFDNLYNNDITAVVVHAVRAGLGPQVTAQKIAALARQRAQDKNRQTPFSAAAQDAGFRYYGGKLDDITVVVSYITSERKEGPSNEAS